MSEHRGNEQHEIERTGDTVDYISNLPDCILHHILSFMPTKEVVKASILSARWKNLWASVPNIDIDDTLLYFKRIDDRYPLKVTSFMNFVEKVLRVRGASNLEKFHLRCRTYCNPSQIHLWISYAIMHNHIQELDLCLINVTSSVVPSEVFNSMSLTSLKINAEWFEIPSHVSFPCLKTLHLSHVGFVNDDAKRLLSGCRILENLVLSYISWFYLKNIVISCSTLKSLTIHDDSSYFDPLGDPTGCKINIDAANLTYFDYIGHLSNEIHFNNMPSLVKACIDIPLPRVRRNEVACRAVDLIKQLQYVVSLRLSNFTMKSLIRIDNTPHQFPVFQNLSHLTLTKEIENYTFGALVNFLYFCPILRSICLSKGFARSMDLGEIDRIWIIRPIYISNCLKTVIFKNFSANDSEIFFLKCILKIANILERIDIYWSKTRLGVQKKEPEVRKQLEMIGRISTTCVIKFS